MQMSSRFQSRNTTQSPQINKNRPYNDKNRLNNSYYDSLVWKKNCINLFFFSLIWVFIIEVWKGIRKHCRELTSSDDDVIVLSSNHRPTHQQFVSMTSLLPMMSLILPQTASNTSGILLAPGYKRGGCETWVITSRTAAKRNTVSTLSLVITGLLIIMLMFCSRCFGLL